ncbi:MAG TPA: hypothetical protein VH186_33610 [Chloroflexia bacterium]|nr:hypothetical protein [Chloroflexia bacterium]
MQELDGDLATNDNTSIDKPEQTERKPLTSGIGRRGSATPESEIAKVGSWTGTGEKRPVRKSTANKSTSRMRSKGSGGIGRGGITAIALLVVFLPLVLGLGYLLIDSNNQVESLKRNLEQFNKNSISQSASDFIALLSDPRTQIVPFKSEDLNPGGRMVLYSGDRLHWAISYGRLDPLGKDEAYALWLVSKPVNGSGSTYFRMALLPDMGSSGNARLLQENEFPAGFNINSYSELLVTVEKIDKPGDKPSGPRRFSLDLTQITNS